LAQMRSSALHVDSRSGILRRTDSRNSRTHCNPTRFCWRLQLAGGYGVNGVMTESVHAIVCAVVKVGFIDLPVLACRSSSSGGGIGSHLSVVSPLQGSMEHLLNPFSSALRLLLLRRHRPRRGRGLGLRLRRPVRRRASIRSRHRPRGGVPPAVCAPAPRELLREPLPSRHPSRSSPLGSIPVPGQGAAAPRGRRARAAAGAGPLHRLRARIRATERRWGRAHGA
jgi:hypothetical protein